MTAAELAAAVVSDLPGAVEAHEDGPDMPTLAVPPGRLLEVCTWLRDRRGMSMLMDVVAVDYLGYGGEVAGYFGTEQGRDINRAGSWGRPETEPPPPKRFGVKYHLASVHASREVQREIRRVRVQVWADDGEPVPSVVPIWPTADWHEREAYDFMGIVFDGHPNLRRLLLPHDWEGHVQRKDYPLGGEPVQFSDAV